MNEVKLVQELQEWSKEVNINRSHFLDRDPIAKEIKRIVESWGYWARKLPSRATCRKGYYAMLKKLEQKNSPTESAEDNGNF